MASAVLRPTTWHSKQYSLGHRYLPWNLLEPRPGEFVSNLTHPELDFIAFVREAEAAGLLVSIRAGPYITAEHDFGGYPWWLLQHTTGENASHASSFRTTAPWFTSLVDRYWDHVIPPLAELLYSKGGPIISFQIDDDSSGPGGECNCSLPSCKYFGYFPFLRDGLRQRGIVNTLITTVGFSDNARTAEVLQTIEDVHSIPYDAAGIAASLSDLKQRQPHRPLWVGELYPGHADFVGSAGHYVGDSGNFSSSLAAVLKAGASMTMYMGSGGSNFGTAGSMLFGANGSVFSKSVTQSYDFDAPITESGDPHPQKFAAVRAVLSPADRTKPVPAALPKAAHGRVEMQHSASLLTVKAGRVVTAAAPQTFEELGNGFGMVLYTQTAMFSGDATLNLTALRDRGVVLLNGRLQGVLGSWRPEPPPHQPQLQPGHQQTQTQTLTGPLDAAAGFDPAAIIVLRSNVTTQPQQNVIAVLAENLGLPCDYSLRFGLSVGWRGIGGAGPVTLLPHGGGSPIRQGPWTMRTIDFAELASKGGRSKIDAEWSSAATYKHGSSSSGGGGWQPSVYTAEFSIAPGAEASAGSFLRFEAAEWGSGLAAVNGWLLGRFDAASAQRTLYVPRTLLRAGKNEVIVAETSVGERTAAAAGEGEEEVGGSWSTRGVSFVGVADLGQPVPL